MMQNINLSAVILTRIGTPDGGESIQSVDFCDEIIIVYDKNSIPGQVGGQIRNSKIKIFKHDLANNFAEQRNFGLGMARGRWVLFVDSDEVVSEALASEIVNLKSRILNQYHGFYIKRKIVFLGKAVGEDKVLRLARKDSGKWVRAVHETWDVAGRAATLKNYIIHNTAGNLHEYLEKINKYSDIHARENLKESKRSNIGKIIFYPILKFWQNMLLGRGFVFSLLQSFHSFLSWTKLWIIQKKNYK